MAKGRLQMTKAQAVKEFKAMHDVTQLEKKTIRGYWREYMDYLFREDAITEKQFETWKNPFESKGEQR